MWARIIHFHAPKTRAYLTFLDVFDSVQFIGWFVSSPRWR